MNDDRRAVTREELREELARYPTRENLREELARYPTRDELKETLREELARYPTRDELKETLREELARYPTRDELKETLREELTRFVTRDDFGLWMQTIARQHDLLVASIADLGQTMKASHEALFVEIGRAAQAAAEEHRRELGVLDDRYRDLPGRVATLERDLDRHRSDTALHTPPRRPRR